MPPENSGRKQGSTRFRRGQSGNPAGKPPGARHATTLLAEKLMSNDVAGVVKAVISAAQSGDMQAARIVMDRLVPVRKGAPIPFALPTIATADDVNTALAEVASLMAAGELSPDEASTVAGVIELRRKAIEATEFAGRLAAIEQTLIQLQTKGPTNAK